MLSEDQFSGNFHIHKDKFTSNYPIKWYTLHQTSKEYYKHILTPNDSIFILEMHEDYKFWEDIWKRK